MLPIGLSSHCNDVIRPIRPGPKKSILHFNGLRVLGTDVASRLVSTPMTAQRNCEIIRQRFPSIRHQLDEMNDVLVRHCGPGDYAGVVTIYNHYIEHSSATFDVVPYSVGARAPWFAQFAETGPYQLLVAISCDKVVGFCCSTRFKSRAAYEVSIETTAYVAPGALGQGIGFKMYNALFAGVAGNDLHGAYAGITLPNEASVALHQKLGFRKIGVFEEVGRKFDRYWSVAWFEKRI